MAVRVLPAHVSQDPDRKARFEREARTISKLNHPNICTLHDVGLQNGVDILVMEYLEGETLAQFVAKAPLPTQQVLPYGAKMADALACAHKQGIVHRDLKPANVLVAKSGINCSTSVWPGRPRRSCQRAPRPTRRRRAVG